MTILSEENTFNEGNVDEADGFNSQGPPASTVIPQAASSNGSLLGALSQPAVVATPEEKGPPEE